MNGGRSAVKMRSPRVLLIMLIVIIGSKTNATTVDDSRSGRQKRFLWITHDGRLALPPGTTMVLTPSLSMPLIRHPLKGFLSNMSISLPFTVDFDKLGLTDNENPFGDPLNFLDENIGRSAGSMVADLLGRYVRGRRSTREHQFPEMHPGVQKQFDAMFHGGERVLLYESIEDMLAGFGLPGRDCLLRAICEAHAYPLKGYGLVGEILKLFLSASKSPFKELLTDHIKAEEAGGIDGDCWKYYAKCEKSLFQGTPNKYSKEAELQHKEALRTNEIGKKSIQPIVM